MRVDNRMTMRELAEHQRRHPPRKHPDDEEHRIQVACVNRFRIEYPAYNGLLNAVPNGGWRNKAVAAKLKAEGVVAGVADLELNIARGGYHGLKIEMKTEKGKQSPAQKDWQRLIEAQGYRYVICRSLEDFITAIDDYLKI